jgi:predicted metal-binding membrane protein
MRGSGAVTGPAVSRLAEDPRAVTLAVVALVAAGLWLAIWQAMAAMPMGGMPGMAMSVAPPDWSIGTVASTVAMWLLMMAAMMLPAMAPMLAVYAGLAAKEDRGGALALRIGVFALGYFLLWAMFSVAAALGQLALRDSAWFTMGGTLATPVAAGVLLLIAGAHQFTAIKDLCVRHCRHPLAYLMVHWREGLRGAFPVGARHGVYCFGCCIALMGLMFVFGAMNVLWMAVIALYFLAEKVLPHERVWGRVAGGMMLVAGAVMLVREAI